MKIVQILNILILSTLVSQVNAQNSQVTWSSFNMGFMESISSDIMLKSVAGQNLVGSLGYGNSFIQSGFLADTLFRSTFVNINEQINLPSLYKLYQNYPNPFNPTITIKYDLPMSSHVTIKLYNVLGQEVMTLVNEEQEAGCKILIVDASSLAGGVYIYQIKTGDFRALQNLYTLNSMN